MNSQPVIYAAGNPDLYPLEYYDKETEDFQGAIPDLLRQFAQDNGYELRYYQSGMEDRREELAENRQVDLISGCVDGEHYSHTAGQALTLSLLRRTVAQKSIKFFSPMCLPKTSSSSLVLLSLSELRQNGPGLSWNIRNTADNRRAYAGCDWSWRVPLRAGSSFAPAHTPLPQETAADRKAAAD